SKTMTTTIRQRVAVACLFAGIVFHALASAALAREFSVDLWDWTQHCGDLPTFKLWAADLKKVGVTRIEISAPWNLLEPKPGEYDLAFVADRYAIAKS